jgi:ferredoxin
LTINSITLVYFSPTRTTKQIIEGIAKGIQNESITHLDLTPPIVKDQEVGEFNEELVIIGAPVYGGRIPVDAVSRLQRLKANNTPAVVVVVYGNRAYEDALVELRDLALKGGFKPVAGGAFIAEHSFNTEDTPIAKARPDEKDLKKVLEFGEKIQATMEEYRGSEDVPRLQVPGNHPYKARGQRSEAISPITKEEQCILCGQCAEVCPTAAITINTEVVTQREACIHCCACVKNCPSNARVMEHPRIRKIAIWLSMNFSERKEPEIYLAS